MTISIGKVTGALLVVTVLLGVVAYTQKGALNAPTAAVAQHIRATLTGEQLCARDLKKFVTFNDPDSVRINSVEPNPDRPGRYYLSISAKNGFGGYGDPTTCTCGTNAERATVTDLHCDQRGG